MLHSQNWEFDTVDPSVNPCVFTYFNFTQIQVVIVMNIIINTKKLDHTGKLYKKAENVSMLFQLILINN